MGRERREPRESDGRAMESDESAPMGRERRVPRESHGRAMESDESAKMNKWGGAGEGMMEGFESVERCPAERECPR